MIEIKFYGRGGQGAVIASQILARVFFLMGKYPQCFSVFGGERRDAPVLPRQSSVGGRSLLSKGLTSPPPPAKPAEPPPLLAEARWIPTSDVSQQRTPGVSPWESTYG